MTKRAIRFEIVLLLLLSLGASAIYSSLDLAQTLLAPGGIGGSTTSINPQQSQLEIFDFLYRVVGLLLALVPVALALFLLGGKWKSLGLWPVISSDWVRGAILFLGIGIPGLLLYLAARSLGLASKIIPGEIQYWWLVPVLLLSALRAALQEEVIMVGYLFARFDEIGIRFRNQQLISAAIRASYHSYQGFAGIVGNFVMGLVFGWAYRRWGRVLPLVIAHFILDAISFVGYALLAKQLANFGGLF